MDTETAVNLITQTFEAPFDEARFLTFVRNLLNQIDESKAFTQQGAYIWDAFKDHVRQYKRLGTYTDPDGLTVDVLVVRLKKASALDRARTMQRNFVARYLKERDAKDAALVAYYVDNVPDWRFSLVKMEYQVQYDEDAARLKVAEVLTPARRYSFLVGAHEPNHTAQAQLVPILRQTRVNPTLAQLEAAFSIEPVTQDFFEKYKARFLDLKEELDALVAATPALAAEFTRAGVTPATFAKKLLGQLVFLAFLQKKGWLGVAPGQPWGSGPHDFLRRLFDKQYGPYTNFFNEVLEPLFYEALAVARPDHTYAPLGCRIPFLNGGLFEPVGGYDWRGVDVLLDNASFRAILDTFARYNFTVREDEPLEKEVAVDPEMLGRVFENLLDVQDRKSKGAFYTPREIVHYMCQESLINYLDTTINTPPPNPLPACREGEQEPRHARGERGQDLHHVGGGGEQRSFLTHGEGKHQLPSASGGTEGGVLPPSASGGTEGGVLPPSASEGTEGGVLPPSANGGTEGGVLPPSASGGIEGGKRIPREDLDIFIRRGELALEHDAAKAGGTQSYTYRLPGSIRENAAALDAALADIKICDPAIGSGAFPVGLMHEIVKARTVLTTYFTPPPSPLPARGEGELRPPPASGGTEGGVLSSASGGIEGGMLPPVCGGTEGGWQTSPDLWQKLKPLARQMRRDPTPAERKLWQRLRRKQMHGYKFRRQHAIDRFIVDFYCRRARLVVEVDGPIHDYTVEQDAVRQEFLESQNLRVLRFSNEAVLTNMGAVLAEISRVVETPPPSPLPARREGGLRPPPASGGIEGGTPPPSASGGTEGGILPPSASGGTEGSILPPSASGGIEGGSERIEGGKSRTPYALKRHTIQHSIYGVDIDPGAVDIAKLRLWLSLVVDEDSYAHIQPLPNLDYKIVCGNALLGFPENWRSPAFAHVEQLKQRYFSETDPQQKAVLRAQIDEAIQTRLDNAEEVFGYPVDFDFRLFFSEVFHAKGGFDVVIGNPPYVRHERIRAQKPALKEAHPQVYQGTADLYVYFYDQGIKILHDYGFLAFITSNKFMRARYGKKLRQFLIKKTTPRTVIDFGDLPVFDATAYPCIVMTEKATAPTDNIVQALTVETVPQIQRITQVMAHQAWPMPQYKALTAKEWRLEPPEVLALLEKLRKAGTPLGEYVGGRFYYGIKTGYNKAFIVDRSTRDHLIAEHPASAEIIKPMLRGRDVKQWRVEFAEQYLIKIESSQNVTHPWSDKPDEVAEKIFAQTYPAIYAHFEPYRVRLIKRYDQGDYFWELRSCAYWDELEKSKIVYQEIATYQRFAYDTESFYTNKTVFSIPTDNLTLIGLLNSSVVWWFLKNICSSIQGGSLTLQSIYIEQVPIPPELIQQREVEALVTRILDAKAVDPDADVSILEAEIDRMVYQLYGLTEEEIAIVEKAVG
jgi:very-short-patch-repair endonuclease